MHSRVFREATLFLGAVCAIGAFALSIGGVIIVYETARNLNQVELFPSAITYLDTMRDEDGEAFYLPTNGPEFCLGDEIQWRTNAIVDRASRLNISAYLQVERDFEFLGDDADALEARFPGAKQTIENIYYMEYPPLHLTKGEFLGGSRTLILPTEDMLRPHTGIEAGDRVRVFIDIEGVLSEPSGFYIPFTIEPACAPIPATMAQESIPGT